MRDYRYPGESPRRYGGRMADMQRQAEHCTITVPLHGYEPGQVVYIGKDKFLVTEQIMDEIACVPFTRWRWCTMRLGTWFDRTGWKWLLVPCVLALLWLVRQAWLMQEALL